MHDPFQCVGVGKEEPGKWCSMSLFDWYPYAQGKNKNKDFSGSSAIIFIIFLDFQDHRKMTPKTIRKIQLEVTCNLTLK